MPQPQPQPIRFRLAALLLLCAAMPAAAAPPLPPPRAAAPVLPGDRPLDAPLICLARAVYFEARGRGMQELSAVAHVVLNRRAYPRRPDTICGVVKQGGPKPPCQFSWWCDGRGDVARHAGEYAAATRAAWRALNGITADPTGGANMFHAARIKPPRWARAATRTARIGAHVFYRLDGP